MAAFRQWAVFGSGQQGQRDSLIELKANAFFARRDLVFQQPNRRVAGREQPRRGSHHSPVRLCRQKLAGLWVISAKRPARSLPRGRYVTFVPLTVVSSSQSPGVCAAFIITFSVITVLSARCPA